MKHSIFYLLLALQIFSSNAPTSAQPKVILKYLGDEQPQAYSFSQKRLDGNIWVVESQMVEQTPWNNWNRVYFVRLYSPDGNIISSHLLPVEDVFNGDFVTAAVLSDGGFVVLQSLLIDGVIYRFNSNGAYVARIDFPEDDCSPFFAELLPTFDGNFVLVSPPADNSIFAVNAFFYNRKNEVAAIRRWGSESENNFWDFKNLRDGTYASLDMTQFVLYRFQKNSQQAATLSLEQPSVGTQASIYWAVNWTTDGGFFLVGSLQDSIDDSRIFVKYNAEGKIEFEWQKDFDFKWADYKIDEIPFQGWVLNFFEYSKMNAASAFEDPPKHLSDFPTIEQFFISKKGETLAENRITGSSVADISNPDFLPGYAFSLFFTAFQTSPDDIDVGFYSVEFPDKSVAEGQLKIFPNPAAAPVATFNSEKMGNCQLSVFDAAGRLVHSENIRKTTRQQSFFLQNLDCAAGLYFLKIELEGERLAGRWVKM